MVSKWISACSITVLLLQNVPGQAWSNRGHRLVNLAAVENLPPDMPEFFRASASEREISFLGPEPDRWRPSTEPELVSSSSPDHDFFLELGEPLFPLPRTRYEYFKEINAFRSTHKSVGAKYTPEAIGTLPWQVLEVYERLTSAFRSYRVLTGKLPESTLVDIQPMTQNDLPDVEQTILFYSGWLGHYVGDASQPLHTTINTDGWREASNPHGYSRKPGIHSQFESLLDRSIEIDLINVAVVGKQMTPAHYLADPFSDFVSFLEESHRNVPIVYELQKADQFKIGAPGLKEFQTQCIAAGSSMLRNLIYTAWLRSGQVKPDVAILR